jgi:hypothetical protein
MVETRLERRRGEQPGNRNAVSHGRHTAAGRAARGAALEEQRAADRDRPAAWAATIPKTDYGRIIDELCATSARKRRKNVLMASVMPTPA